MLVLNINVTCFICIIYHYYTFSGTNLLTRCHSASSLFSAVFGSRKVLRAIFSEFDETKAKPPIFPRDTRSQKGKPGGGPRPPNHLLTRPGPQARREVRREPRTSADIAPSPIYCLRRENPKGRSHIFQKSSAAPPPSTTSFGG